MNVPLHICPHDTKNRFPIQFSDPEKMSTFPWGATLPRYLTLHSLWEGIGKVRPYSGLYSLLFKCSKLWVLCH